jgi:hypothetical protein
MMCLEKKTTTGRGEKKKADTTRLTIELEKKEP